jgi:general stress protein YciG
MEGRGTHGARGSFSPQQDGPGKEDRTMEQPSNTPRAPRGFAAMDPEKQRAIASKGGKASGGNFRNDPARAAAAGKKGGEASGGNFAHDRMRASEAGRKGGRS